ncbi:MAG: serine/threonine protein kinase, partial [Nostoc sp.]
MNLSAQKAATLIGKTTQNRIHRPSAIAQPPAGIAKETVLAKKLGSSKVFIGMGVALVAATAGFGITSILPKSQPQPTAKPLFEQPTQQSPAKVPNFDRTSSPPGEETNTTSRTESAPVSNSKQRRRNRRSSQEESSSSPTPESQRGDSQQSPPSPSVSPTPSLVEKLRAIRSS